MAFVVMEFRYVDRSREFGAVIQLL